MGKRLSQNAWVVPVVIGICLLAIFLLGRDLPQQIGRLERIQAAQSHLRPYLESERSRQQALQEQLEEVASPEFVEKWARERGHWARPGEVLLVLPTPVLEPSSSGD
ncbi:MAG TPA: hypothetical protein ENK08_11870 [Chloroflexi bacterium]|nr:hypothetical protein [Chloroflexota bacterium]